MPRLTASRLRELLDYDSVSGRFTWRVNRRGRNARKGAIAGTLRADGHRQICIDCRLYWAGPLAVLWMTGKWPSRLVDHRNGDSGDDRWLNLREATHSQNAANAKGRAKLKGVTWDKARGKYIARIKVEYRNIHLGRFDQAEQAHAAYVAAAQTYFGEFAREA